MGRRPRRRADPPCEAAQRAHQTRAAQEIEKPRGHQDLLAAFFDPKLLRPDDDGPPQQLVQHRDHRRHRDDGQEHRVGATLFYRHAHVRADAGQPEVALTQLERLVDHQKEPTARHAQHAVPHEPQGRERQLDLPQSLPPREAIDGGGLAQVGRNRAQRVDETEGHVPCLSREDHDDRGELETDVAARKQRDEGEDKAGHEPEDRDALQDVEQREQHASGDAIPGGPITVDQREAEGNDVRQ